MKVDAIIQEAPANDPDKTELQFVQKKKKVKQFVSSIEPHPNHMLYEFHWNPSDKSFSVFETAWRQVKELVLKNVNGRWQPPVKEKEVIDILNPFVQTKKKSYDIEIKDGVAYVTALNYGNAVRKFKKLNPQYFQ